MNMRKIIAVLSAALMLFTLLLNSITVPISKHFQKRSCQ